jgi:integrase
VEALNAWMAAAKIDKRQRVSGDRALGHGFAAGDRSAVGQRDLQAAGGMAGLEPGEFSAHGLRSGYLTEAANRGIPLPEAMEQSRHRSVQQASSYYNNATRRSGRAARTVFAALPAA